MHIPDGLMDPWVLALGWVCALAALAFSLRKMEGTLDRRTVPLMGVLAGAIFVGQMINFPIGGGTTGHLVGAALAVALVGRDKGLVVITSILMVQCLLFGDGGITALGLNIFNMGVVAVFVSWVVFRIMGDWNRKAAILTASWASIFVASLACSLQLAASHDLSGGAYGIVGGVAIPMMLVLHAIIGVGEAVITFGAITYLEKVAPEMFGADAALNGRKARKGVAA
jgi:cobalt/nickel transport system permease protein